MHGKTLIVVARVRAKPGKEAEMRKELLSLVAPSRKDPGCISYDLHQALDNPASFMFYENWAGKADLDQHLHKEDLQTVLGRVGLLAAEPPEISLWEKLA